MTFSTKNIEETEHQTILREACLSNHLIFTRYMFKERTGSNLIVNRHHQVICQTLDKIFTGEITRLIINIAPRYTKTEMAVIGLIARGLAVNPASEFIHTSFSDTLVRRNSMLVREIIESEAYQELWPLNMKKDTRSKKAWKIDHYNGGLIASSMGGTLTGFGAGLMKGPDVKENIFTGALILDDPLKPANAYSDTLREESNRYMCDTLMSRLADKDVPVVLTMQRIHENDLTGFLLKGGTGEKWHHLCLPCEITDECKLYDYDEYPYGIPIEYDLENGALWPYKHTLEDLKVMRDASPYVTAAQYDQKPTPLGGSIFKDEWWRYYNSSVPPKFEYRFITGDTAQTEKTYSDYTVFACWGVFEGKLYLIDLIREKWETPDVIREFIDFWNKHEPGWEYKGVLRAAHIENKSSGTALIQDRVIKNKIKVIPINRHIDKVRRALDSVDYCTTGRIFLPENAPFMSDFKNELRKFTPTFAHANDDQVDTFMDAIEVALMPPKRIVRGFNI